MTHTTQPDVKSLFRYVSQNKAMLDNYAEAQAKIIHAHQKADMVAQTAIPAAHKKAMKNVFAELMERAGTKSESEMTAITSKVDKTLDKRTAASLYASYMLEKNLESLSLFSRSKNAIVAQYQKLKSFVSAISRSIGYTLLKAWSKTKRTTGFALNTAQEYASSSMTMLNRIAQRNSYVAAPVNYIYEKGSELKDYLFPQVADSALSPIEFCIKRADQDERKAALDEMPSNPMGFLIDNLKNDEEKVTEVEEASEEPSCLSRFFGC